MRVSDRLLLVAVAVIAGCTSTVDVTTTSSPATTTPSTLKVDLPEIAAVTPPDEPHLAYRMIQLEIDVDAVYENPYDQRQVAVDARFEGPTGETIVIPGFWDGEGSWLLRFTPTDGGTWSYEVKVRDGRGNSIPTGGVLEVEDSDHRGFLRIASDVDPGLSSRYFAFEDGTPWYGRGHADLDMSLGGPASDGTGLAKFDAMSETGENYEMWWPMWGNNFLQASYDDYSAPQMGVIDYVVEEAEAAGVSLIYTIWGHQFLRSESHDWPDARWNFNGFSELTSLDEFFTDDEAWAWQENYYRYVIARWSYSPAIAMWQTVTEINGTEAYEHTDEWHERVNAYFQTNDPYRHPTTATKSGAQDWPQGHAVMDVPQVHLYHVFGDNPIADTLHFAEWTSLMWDRAAKPNWIGEYGNRVQALYPEFMHNANWVSLATGAALTPTEWNDGNAFSRFDDEMAEDMARFSQFVEHAPLAVFDPERVEISTNDEAVRGWGLAGQTGGFVWLQDHALEEASIDVIRSDQTLREVSVTVDSLTPGQWSVTPYLPWVGEWTEPIEVDCPSAQCTFEIPPFSKDIALLLTSSD